MFCIRYPLSYSLQDKKKNEADIFAFVWTSSAQIAIDAVLPDWIQGLKPFLLHA